MTSARTPMSAPEEHPDALTMAAFMDGTIAPDGRGRLLEHLAECTECREEVQHVHRLLAERPATTGIQARRWMWSAGFAAAAALLVWVAPQVTRVATPSATEAPWPATAAQPGGTTTDRERTDSSLPELDAPLAVFTDSLQPRTGSLTLTWQRAGNEASYDVVLQDEAGGVRYRTTTSDTTHVLDQQVLDGTTRVYLRVHAHLLDGSERSSSAHVIVRR